MKRRCENRVIRLTRPESAKNGSFSSTSRVHDSRRARGQTSSSKSANGRGTSVGLASRPKTSEPNAPQPGGARTAARVVRVTPERQHREHAREHVLALRDPGHRFDPQRVPGEERRGRRAAPGGAGQAAQRREEQRRSQRVQQDVARVVAARPVAEELGVEHVRVPGERMPGRTPVGEAQPVLRAERPRRTVGFPVTYLSSSETTNRSRASGRKSEHASPGERHHAPARRSCLHAASIRLVPQFILGPGWGRSTRALF